MLAQTGRRTDDDALDRAADAHSNHVIGRTPTQLNARIEMPRNDLRKADKYWTRHMTGVGAMTRRRFVPATGMNTCGLSA